ncbi:hypothetical protein FHX42_003907 [Saccharopolyspora lacisalsi]|uniref:Uncharacterized protein n=1 Tax=Halosaccharopolyspora lacisalsi TaxID=1000566 RepID=A0A839E5C4_9PSEU|nr:hypothetical protein [Halosaccharopolyspora lacisalsi]
MTAESCTSTTVGTVRTSVAEAARPAAVARYDSGTSRRPEHPPSGTRSRTVDDSSLGWSTQPCRARSGVPKRSEAVAAWCQCG